MITIALPIGALFAAALGLCVIVNMLLMVRRRRRLQRLRARQEAVRLRALERQLQPPRMARLRQLFRRRE